MKHAFISPINYLQFIPEDSDFHLLLAHLLTDEKYCEFYRNRQKKGDFIIIDNGAFEFKKPLEPAHYSELVLKSGIVPDVIVAPDYPSNGWKKTIKAAEQFASEYGNHFDTNVTKLMVVPQSMEGDHLGWLGGYEEMLKFDNVEFVGMSILGIPNAFCYLTGTKDITFNRNYATTYLLANDLADHSINHHYLGCSDPRELLMMKVMGLAHSNDSSTAIWHGINHIAFDESSGGLVNGKLKREVDFDLALDNGCSPTILRNIEWINGILKK